MLVVGGHKGGQTAMAPQRAWEPREKIDLKRPHSKGGVGRIDSMDKIDS